MGLLEPRECPAYRARMRIFLITMDLPPPIPLRETSRLVESNTHVPDLTSFPKVQMSLLMYFVLTHMDI